MQSATKAAAACTAASGTLPCISRPHTTAPKMSPVPWYSRGMRGVRTTKLPPSRPAPTQATLRPAGTPVTTAWGQSCVSRAACWQAVSSVTAGEGTSPKSSAASVVLGRTSPARAHSPRMAGTMSSESPAYIRPLSPSTGSTTARASGHRSSACSASLAWLASAR